MACFKETEMPSAGLGMQFVSQYCACTERAVSTLEWLLCKESRMPGVLVGDGHLALPATIKAH